MAAPKLNTFQVNGPKRTLINSGTVPNKRVVLKGTDGKPIEKKKPALTPEEAADILHCGMNAIYKLLNDGKIKAMRIGRRWKIPKRAVQEYIITASQMKAAGW
mgnify:CR=1 FL=1